jgi:hypothetical protein
LVNFVANGGLGAVACDKASGRVTEEMVSSTSDGFEGGLVTRPVLLSFGKAKDVGREGEVLLDRDPEDCW